MKKILVVLTALILISSFACAESAWLVAETWNIYGSDYSAVKLSEDMANTDGNKISFAGDGWEIIFVMDGKEYKQIGIYAEDFQTLMCNAATAGFMVGGEPSGFREYLGNISYQYLTLISGGTPLALGYGGYAFNTVQRGKGYVVLLIKQ